jgi:hypothetical protein
MASECLTSRCPDLFTRLFTQPSVYVGDWAPPAIKQED